MAWQPKVFLSGKVKPVRDPFEVGPRSGGPTDVISQEMMDHVERLVLNNLRIKVAKLASECGISKWKIRIFHANQTSICLDTHLK